MGRKLSTKAKKLRKIGNEWFDGYDEDQVCDGERGRHTHGNGFVSVSHQRSIAALASGEFPG
jgi:hypothetical protein